MHLFLASTGSSSDGVLGCSRQMESFTGQLLLPLPEHADFSTASWNQGELVEKVGVSGLCTRPPPKAPILVNPAHTRRSSLCN